MSYFKDLSDYSYRLEVGMDAHAQNIGWLTQEFEFEVAAATPCFIDRLWHFCTISINQTRGLHICKICQLDQANSITRNDQSLLLGSAEIRVFSPDGQTYAAPNLIYHFVTAHNYSPPSEFVQAVLFGPCPPHNAYFEELANRGYIWNATLIPDDSTSSFRFVKTLRGIEKVIL
jgi:hypothetical protein